MSDLDSRWLRYGDRYIRRFPQAGAFQYHVQVQGDRFPVSAEFFVNVTGPMPGPPPDPAQSNAVINLFNFNLAVDPTDIQIRANDLICWLTDDPGLPGFRLVERDGVFDSSKLQTGSVFSHPFGAPGEYPWADAINEKVEGVVIVNPPAALNTNKSRDDYMKTLAQGAVVSIHDTVVTPSVVTISVGQTVFWIIEKSDGISVTDKRLL